MSSQPSPTPSSRAQFAAPPEQPFRLHRTFTKDNDIVKGTVRIKVEDVYFYCHREVLMLASPFFEGLLRGEWAETCPPAVNENFAAVQMDKDKELPGSGKRESYQTVISNASTNTDIDDGVDEMPTTMEQKVLKVNELALRNIEVPIPQTPDKLQIRPLSFAESIDNESLFEDDPDIICRLKLPEEKPSSFQDLLCHIYPRLDCLISWQNVEDLYSMAHKFDIPSLKTVCVAFLLPSAAGKPIMAMKIAEDWKIPELYKEGSRYVLDTYHNLSQSELGGLSFQTRLKLERKRTWFLERLFKFAQLPISKEFVCQASCPDPSICGSLLDEKWKSAWLSLSRYVTPQPSILYRSLRSLEPSLSSPPLHLAQTACQKHAQLYVADLFDRMFGLQVTPATSWSLLSNSLTGGRTYGPGSEGSSARNRAFLAIDLFEENIVGGTTKSHASKRSILNNSLGRLVGE